MVSAAQVNELVVQFGSGKIDSKQFLQQFALLSHNIHRCEDKEAVRLCNLLEARIGDVISGHLPLSDLQKLALSGDDLGLSETMAPAVTIVRLAPVYLGELASSAVMPFSASGTFSPQFGANAPPNQISNPIPLVTA
jgi:hypothetical protein